MYDIVINNATIVDGTGNKRYVANLAIHEEKIAKIGTDDYRGKRVIDATGKILAPGFIDSHGHNDLTISCDHTNSYKLKQGITTEIAGCCGESAFPYCASVPIPEAAVAYTYMDSNMRKHGYRLEDNTSAKYWMDYCEEIGMGTNMMMMIGQGMVRASVMGFENRPATNNELEKMKSMVRDAMENGAYGMSTGIAYAPGVFTPEEEITELCKVVAEYNGIYSTHMRNQGTHLIESVEETIRVVKKTGVRTVISHLKSIGKPNWGKLKIVVKMIAEAQANRLPIVCDVYPYLAGSTTLKITLPPSILEGGGKAIVEKLMQKDWQDYVREQIKNPTEKWENAVGNKVLMTF